MCRVNVEEGPSEDRHMTTGLHTVKDIFCSRCRSVLGWKYVYIISFFLLIDFLVKLLDSLISIVFSGISSFTLLIIAGKSI
jgi:hypothetical protein